MMGPVLAMGVAEALWAVSVEAPRVEGEMAAGILFLSMQRGSMCAALDAMVLRIDRHPPLCIRWCGESKDFHRSLNLARFRQEAREGRAEVRTLQ